MVLKNLLKGFGILLVCGLIPVSCNRDEEIITDPPLPEGDREEFTVLEYMPGPGQFINDPSAGFTSVETEEEACEYAADRLKDHLYVSLGAYGGYIVVRSGESIANSGEFDFSIAGNSFDSSNEPGIVWVMQDKNGNGLPDDEWYELKGSHYDMSGYQRDYSVTYFRSEPDSDIRWESSDGETGVIKWQGAFHSQDSYYPKWVKEENYTLTGSKLPSQAQQNPETGVWSNLPFKWGYADNSGEDSITGVFHGKMLQRNLFRISDAIDADGKSVFIEKIDFIKVQTAVLGSAGVLGENSTEVCGFFRE